MDLLHTLYLIKEFLISGVMKFPLIIGTTTLGLACTTANVGYILLFISLIFIVPFAELVCNKVLHPLLTMLINFVVGLFNKDFAIDWNPKNAAAVCRAAGETSGGAFPTNYMAILFFVFGYTFFNGLAIYNHESTMDESDDKVKTRKAHAIYGMIASLALLLVFLIVRIMSGCEHWMGVVWGAAFIGLAYGVFEFFRFCGLIRLVDLYGIGSRLLPAGQNKDITKVCFPIDQGPVAATPAATPATNTTTTTNTTVPP